MSFFRVGLSCWQCALLKVAKVYKGLGAGVGFSALGRLPVILCVRLSAFIGRALLAENLGVLGVKGFLLFVKNLPNPALRLTRLRLWVGGAIFALLVSGKIGLSSSSRRAAYAHVGRFHSQKSIQKRIQMSSKSNISISIQKYEKIFMALVLFSALFFYSIFIFRTSFSIGDETYFTLVDDAMISMRYAKNLSQGFGMVWNVGETPIQGFTNLGWTLYMAFLHLLPVSASKISLLVMITSALLLSGTTIVSFKIVKHIAPQSENGAIIAAIVTAFYYPLVFWSLRGMEVGILVFLIYTSVLLVIKSSGQISTRKSFWIGLLMLLAIVVRIDVFPQIALILGYVLYTHIIEKRKNIITISPIFIFSILGLLGVLLFQYIYFGSMVPNTYYLKVEGVSLIERLVLGSQVFVEYATRDFLAPAFISVAGLLFFTTLRKKEIFLLITLFIVQCVYSVYVGGDYAEPLYVPQVDAANRFVTQGMLSVIIIFSVVIDKFLLALGMSKDDHKQKLQLSKMLIVLGISFATIITISGEPWFKWGVHNAPLLNADIWRTKLGLHIKNNTEESAVIATHAAGQIPYYSNRRTIDLLGKSDSVIAKGLPATSFRPGHNKWNYEYSILILHPDLIADEWGELNEFLANKSEYVQLENGIWIKKTSNLIDIQGLSHGFR